MNNVKYNEKIMVSVHRDYYETPKLLVVMLDQEAKRKGEERYIFNALSKEEATELCCNIIQHIAKM